MSGLQARRATIDDLPKLRGLWAQHQLPLDDLEKRLTEFQIVLADNGELIGAAALHIDQHHGRIHSVTTPVGELDPEVRQLLWDRVQAVARNNGLVRLWQPEHGPLMKTVGFEPPAPQNISKAPTSFGVAEAGWTTLKLREEAAAAAISLDGEFAVFAQSQRDSTAKLMEQGKSLRTAAYGIALVFMVVVGVLGFIVFRKAPALKQSGAKAPSSREATNNTEINGAPGGSRTNLLVPPPTGNATDPR